ncbi:hypothetical protein [Pseudomonas sp. Irchel 3E13]|uniref:hypothetical protein n=1 Tax=Pseudomonas sp. Irchel 3E13 TaxID=2008975 RepID=UPI000BA4BA85|nr:hypothetical protein [Pseudomonas sp. Irchel 3E13]
MQKYTVIAIVETTGQIVSNHVLADHPQNAFASAAAMHDNLTLIVALPGWQVEDKSVHFPGESSVDSATVLGQPEVFGEPPCKVTAGEVSAVLKAYSLRVCNTNGLSFDDMAKELVQDLDPREIISATYTDVPNGASAEICQQVTFDGIHAALVATGTIEF